MPAFLRQRSDTIRIISFFIFIVLLISFQSCRELPNDVESNADLIIINSTEEIVETGSSVGLDISIPAATKAFSVMWLTDKGRIKGTGNNVIFEASGNSGIATIRAKIYKNGVFFAEKTIKLPVYKQRVILKADDLLRDPINVIPVKWQKFFEIIRKKKIKASLGIIGQSLENGNQAYFKAVKSLVNEGRFEIWNHGYEHFIGRTNARGETYDEFRNTSIDYQIEHIRKTQDLSRQKLGIILRAFGSPGNGYDENTSRALEEFPEIRIWFFAKSRIEIKILIPRVMDFEFPAPTPDFNKFLQNYSAKEKLITLQIHPYSWQAGDFIEFEKIIDYLISENVVFILPFEYLKSIRSK